MPIGKATQENSTTNRSDATSVKEGRACHQEKGGELCVTTMEPTSNKNEANYGMGTKEQANGSEKRLPKAGMGEAIQQSPMEASKPSIQDSKSAMR